MAAELICLVGVAILSVRLILNWSTLSSVPGPILAGVSDLWRAYHQYRGQLRPKLIQLHKKHGPLVRYGVNNVSISDASAIDAIYGSRAGFVIVSRKSATKPWTATYFLLGRFIQSSTRY